MKTNAEKLLDISVELLRNAADERDKLRDHLERLRELIEDWRDNGEYNQCNPREAAIARAINEIERP